MKDNERNLLTEGNIVKKLLQFCIPIMIGTLFQQLYNTVDVLIVGNFVGSDAIASVGGSSGIIINMVINMFVGIASGVTVVISRSFGGRKYKEMKEEINMAVMMAVVGGLLFTLLGILFADNMLALLDTPAEIMESSSNYLKIYFAGITFTVLFNVCSAILRAMGDTKRPLYYLMVCCGVNVLMDVVLVIVFDFGVSGVAIATVISQGISAMLSLRALMKLDEEYRFELHNISFNGKALSSMLWIGCPAAFQSLMNSLSGMVMTAAVNQLGTVAVAGNTTYSKMDNIFWLVSSAFGVAIATFVSQNLGTGKYDRAKKGVRICLMLDIAASGLLSVFFLTFGKYLFLLFTDEAAVINEATQVMLAIAPYYVIVAFYEILTSALRGMDDVMVPMVINILGICGIRVLWIKVIVPLLFAEPGIYHIIISCPVSWIFTALAITVYYLIRTRKTAPKKDEYTSNLLVTR